VKGERREHWLRLCVEAADEQDSNRLLDLVSEINHFLHEKHMRLTNVHREAGGYVIEAAEEKTRPPRAQSHSSGRSDTALKAG
jgi:hypothetical protein